MGAARQYGNGHGDKSFQWEARQDWQRAPKIIVTEEHIALDKKLEPIEEELFDLIKKMPLAIEKKIKGKICVIPSGLKTDEGYYADAKYVREELMAKIDNDLPIYNERGKQKILELIDGSKGVKQNR